MVPQLIYYSDNDTSAYQALPTLFTTFHIEPDTVNDRVHYTSLDGRLALSYCERGLWVMQPHENRLRVDNTVIVGYCDYDLVTKIRIL